MGRLMGMMLVTMITVFDIGCATMLQPGPAIDPRLEKYVKEFEEVYSVKIDFPVQVAPVRAGQGECNKEGAFIDKDFYKKAPEEGVREVVFHELGHCALGRGHDTARIEYGPLKGCPASIMTPNEMLHQTTCWERGKAYYYTELGAERKNILGIKSHQDNDRKCK